MKTIKRTWNVLLTFLMIITSFYATPNVLAITPDDETAITNNDGITLSKEATRVSDRLNEWDIELGVSFEHKPKTQDIVVIIDKSGSMKDNNRMQNAKKAAKDFVDIVLDNNRPHNNRIALISYSTGAHLDQDFTNNQSTLKTKIDAMNADGGTFTQLALKMAREKLENSTADEQIIVLLTDGAPSFGFGLSSTGLAKFSSGATESKRNGYSERTVTLNGGTYSYSSPVSKFSGNRTTVHMDPNKEQNLTEEDFNYNDMGGHGSEAWKYVEQTGSGNNQKHKMLNLFNTNIAEARIVKGQGNTLYTIALDLGDVTHAESTLKEMATTPNHYFKASSSNLEAKFEEIAGTIVFPYSNMSIEDPMAEGVDYVEGTLEALIGTLGETTTNGRKVTVDLKPSSFEYDPVNNEYHFKMKYRVTANDDVIEAFLNSSDDLIETNGDTKLKYQDNGNSKSFTFPKPRVKPTILKVEKTLLDEDGYTLPLKDERLQRAYHYTITDNVENSITTTPQYHVLQEITERTILETSITNDDIDRFDRSIRSKPGNGTETDLPDGKFTLQPESGMNTLRLVNQLKKDHQHDFDVDKSVKDDNDDAYAEKGETLHYEINIHNTSGAFIRDVNIQDDLADIIDYIDTTATTFSLSRNGTKDNNFTSLDTLMTGFLTHMDKDDEIKITFDVLVKDGKKLPEFLTNTVIVNHKDANADIKTGEPIITASKSVIDDNENGYAEAGEKLHYTLTITNSGNVAHRNLDVKDTLSDLLPHIDSITGVKMDVDGTEKDLQDLVDGMSISVDANSTIHITFTVKVKDDFDGDQVESLHNLATIGGEDYETDIPTGKSKIYAKKFVKDDNKNGFAEAGEELHYTIKIKNTGNVVKKDLFIKDSLSELLPYIDNPSGAAMMISGTPSTLDALMDGFTIDVEAGKVVFIRFTVKVKADFDAADVEVLHNIATVGNLTPETEIPTGKPDIYIEKSVEDDNGNGFAEAGETLHYTITIGNNGNVATDFLVLQDDLSELLPHIEDIDNTKMTMLSKEYELQELIDGIKHKLGANHSVSYKFSVTLKDDFDADAVHTLKNIATYGDVEDDAEIPTGKPVIHAEKSVIDDNGNGFAEAGETLHYTIGITNSGNVSQDDLFIQDDLKDLLPYIDDIDGTMMEVNGTSRPLQDLVDGFESSIDVEGSLIITFSVKVKDDFDADDIDTLHNIASVGNHTPETEIPTGKANLTVLKSVRDSSNDDIAEAGEIIHYTIYVENTGKVGLEDVLVQDTLATLMPYIDDISGRHVEIYNSHLDTTTTLALQTLVDGFEEDLPAQSYLILNFSVKMRDDFDADDIDVLRNIASANDIEDDANIPSGKASLELEKYVEDESRNMAAELGETLHYTIIVSNNGNLDKKDVLVQDTLENLLPYIDNIDGIMMDVNGVLRPLQDLVDGFLLDVSSGEEVLITFDVKVKDELEDIDVRTLINTATADDLEATAEIGLEIALEAHEPEPEPTPDKPAPKTGDAKKLPLTGDVNLNIILGSLFILFGLLLALVRRRRENA